MRGSPSVPFLAKSGSSNSRRAAQRRTDLLVAPDDLLLLHAAGCGPRPRCASGSAGPRGRSRRPSSAAAPGTSDGATHTCSSSAAVSSDLRLAVPSLKPNMLRGVTWRLRRRRRAAEAELAPPHRDHAEADPHQVAHRVHRHLGVVRAGLDDDVAARARRVEVVADEARQLAQRLGLAVGQAEPVVEQGRAVADRHREVPGREVERLTGVLRHLPRATTDDATRRRLGAERHPLGGHGPAGQQVAQRLGVVGDDVERDEVQPVLGGRGDAGLALAAERHDPGVGGIRLRPAPSAEAGRAA